ncbi:MAG: sulfite exporter TauE/SafE family protein, partial [Candidatus Latescibacterota bacterium]
MDIFNIYLPISGIEFNILVLISIGFCVGTLGGFFGVGGAWIVTPALNIFGFSMPFAIGTDLAHIFGKSIIATRKHSKLGNVDFRLGAFSIAGSIIGIEAGKRFVL